MRRVIFRCAMLALLTAGAALAADMTGKWTGEFSGPNGSVTITFQLKQDGTKLTGTTEGPGGVLQIQDGKVDGEKFSFVVNWEGGGNTMKILHEGTFKDDELTLTVKVNDQGGPPMKMKRAK